MSYPLVGERVVANLQVGLVASARAGNTSSQRAIFAKFREDYHETYGRKITHYMRWEKLNLEHIGGESEEFTPIDEHCCDDDNCAVCDQNNHGFCRKGCTIGRRW